MSEEKINLSVQPTYQNPFTIGFQYGCQPEIVRLLLAAIFEFKMDAVN
jgi:hypothetical protein